MHLGTLLTKLTVKLDLDHFNFHEFQGILHWHKEIFAQYEGPKLIELEWCWAVLTQQIDRLVHFFHISFDLNLSDLNWLTQFREYLDLKLVKFVVLHEILIEACPCPQHHRCGFELSFECSLDWWFKGLRNELDKPFVPLMVGKTTVVDQHLQLISEELFSVLRGHLWSLN